MTTSKRSDLKPGMKVAIVQKGDQQSGKLTEGIIKEILTKSPAHPHGIKVRLENGAIGRVKSTLD
ncbi:MAG: YwbE family protein [Bacillota bacterium]